MITFVESGKDCVCDIEVYDDGLLIGYIYRGMMGWWWTEDRLNLCLNAKMLQQILNKVEEMNKATNEVEW